MDLPALTRAWTPVVALALAAAAGCAPGKVLVGSPGAAQRVVRTGPLKSWSKGEPTFCTFRAPHPFQRDWPYMHALVAERAPFRDLRLLTREHPGPQGCDVLLAVEQKGATNFGEGAILAYSAYTRELLWEGRTRGGFGLLGVQVLAPLLHRAFQPGEPAFERLASGKAGGRPASVQDVEELAGPELVSERGFIDSEYFPTSSVRLGKAAPVEAERPSAAPPAPVAEARSPSDVDDAPARRVRVGGHAVVIGIERYRERLPKADFAAADARAMARYVSGVLGYDESKVALLTDETATRGDFEKYLERWLPNRVERDDEVFVYFSGHGAPDPETGDAYLVPYDGDPSYLEETAYPLRRLYAALAKLPAKKVTVALDSCFSGTGGRSVAAKGARPLVLVREPEKPSGVTVIAAASGSQISNTYAEMGHGLFTYFLLKGLKEKGADLRQVYEYLRPEVARVARREYNADQEPQWAEGR